jgi:hypothetical protein
MKLKLDFIDEETNERLIVKNKGTKVFYHSSEIHDPNEFEELTGKVLKLNEQHRSIINTFYKLAGEL